MIDGKIISAFAPTVPMWEVYYDQDELYTCPVLALALVEPQDSDHPELDRCVFPMTLEDNTYIGLCREPMSSWASNTLGYSFVADPKKEDWKNEIERYKKAHPKVNT